MSELRRDPVIGRWVIVDTDYPAAPQDFEKEEHQWRRGECPFCYGNEGLTPPEIEAIRQTSTSPNTSGWQVRVVPNKFPALQIEGDLNREGIGIYDMSNGIGAHEVVIETPYHYKDIGDLLNSEVENIIHMWCRRAFDLIKDKRFRYIMIFKNYGPSAGASLEHPHSQIIALPMVPKNVLEELKGAQRYFDYRERCIFCDMLRQEISEKERVILENKHFLAFCPYVSRFPFEVWILPKKHNPYFCHILPEEIPHLATILKDLLNKLKNLFGTPAYNFIIHTTPLDGWQIDAYHWHIEFMPKLTRVAGFEWGTGFYIVSTPPELAAQYFKKV
ncbi:MAG: galactose-1-phosphate uridylyltransferase [Candidatus Omnitrophica bacterium]|nr:galactose-1-phosphate uridylyltransferase [Candidatus Omnitrophota bacterium]